jgi:hypothetical protein
MSSSSKSTSPGGNGLALISFTAGLVPPIAVGLSWLITYSPLTLQAYTTLQTILDGTWVIISVIAAISALVVGIIALVRARHYPPGKAHIGFAIVGVMLGGLEVLIFILIALVFVVVATHP